MNGCILLMQITEYINPYNVNPFQNKSLFLHVCSTHPLKTLWGKGEIPHYEQFLLFPTVFSTLLENFQPFSSNTTLSSANSFSWEEFNTCCLGKG